MGCPDRSMLDSDPVRRDCDRHLRGVSKLVFLLSRFAVVVVMVGVVHISYLILFGLDY
jgi:hypothetical protein